MKTVKYGLAICTEGYSNVFLSETGIAKSMQNILLNDRFGHRFEHKEMLILGGTLNIEKVRRMHSL